MNYELDKKPLNQAIIKYILIILMLLDHTTHYLGESNPLYLPFRMISRLTAPTMAYFIAEGYHYTRDVKKYLKRLFIFTLVSAIPFSLFEYNYPFMFRLVEGQVVAEKYIYFASINKTLIVYGTSVIYTLLLGLIAIILWDKSKINKYLKIIITIGICWLALFGDWKYIDILYCLLFYFFRDNKIVKWSSYTCVSLLYIFDIVISENPFALAVNPKFCLYRIGTILVIPFVELLYNGKPGKKNFMNKWFFYIFYPLHLIILYLLFN